MRFDVVLDFYRENKKLFRVIAIILVVLVCMKVIIGVRNGFRVARTEHVYVVNTYGYSYKDKLITTYYDYEDIVDTYRLESILDESDFDNNDYIMFFIDGYGCEEVFEFNDLRLKSDRVILYFDYYIDCDRECEENEYNMFLIPIKKGAYIDLPKIEIEYESIGGDEACDDVIIDKPILYLYPPSDMEVSVRLENSSVIKTSYPKYNDGWKVYAMSDGSLYDSDSKYYYALYWDEYSDYRVDFSEGFYVARDNALEFLEEKLSIIGLNDRERNEFIMYWLPKLEDNEESLVYFELTLEREEHNKLIINPSPDSMLRVNMHVKKVDGYVDIEEQELVSFERVGFVAVEWGGTIY